MDWTRPHKSCQKLSDLKKSFALLFEPSPAHQALSRACAELSSRFQRASGTSRPRARKFSLFPEDLPQVCKDALTQMELGISGVNIAAPAPSFIKTTRTKLCEFAKSCEHRALPAAITIDALISHERALYTRERSLSSRTICSSLRQIRNFARYIGTSDEVYEHLAKRLRFWENKVTHTPALKEEKALGLPSYAQIFEMVFDFLGSSDEGDLIERQRSRNYAVAVALMCAFPLRLADTQLRFGHEILWDGRRYSFDIVTSKNGAKFQPVLQPAFGFFIDLLVLQGADSKHLIEMRAETFREQRHLFVDYASRPLHPGYVSYAWRQVLGTGSHIARSLVHDRLADLGQDGVELAMAACTHRSQKTAEFYRSRMYELLMVRGAHERVAAQISEAEWAQYVE